MDAVFTCQMSPIGKDVKGVSTYGTRRIHRRGVDFYMMFMTEFKMTGDVLGRKAAERAGFTKLIGEVAHIYLRFHR